MHTISQRNQSIGSVLLEVLVAVTIFSMVAVSLVHAVNQIGMTSVESRRQMHVMRQLQSILLENSKVPEIREGGPFRTDRDSQGVIYEVTVAPMTELRNEEGIVLPQMFSIVASAKWEEAGNEIELTAETWRYAPMYR